MYMKIYVLGIYVDRQMDRQKSGSKDKRQNNCEQRRLLLLLLLAENPKALLPIYLIAGNKEANSG